jgi:hypothetical protein
MATDVVFIRESIRNPSEPETYTPKAASCITLSHRSLLRSAGSVIFVKHTYLGRSTKSWCTIAGIFSVSQLPVQTRSVSQEPLPDR